MFLFFSHGVRRRRRKIIFHCSFLKNSPIIMKSKIHSSVLGLFFLLGFESVYSYIHIEIYLLRDRKFSILCSLFSPSYTCFFSLSLFRNDFFFVAMLDTEHCVLFDLHVRDRVEWKYRRKEEKGNWEREWRLCKIGQYCELLLLLSMALTHHYIPSITRRPSKYRITNSRRWNFMKLIKSDRIQVNCQHNKTKEKTWGR
jgi:hypothetical protein